MREQLLEDVANDGKVNLTNQDYQPRSLAYDKEQQELRRKFLESSTALDDEEGDDDASQGDDDEILVVKQQTPEEIEEAEVAIKHAIAEMVSLKKNKTEDDNFLADFMLNKKWVDKSKNKLKEYSKQVLEEDILNEKEREKNRLLAEDEILDLEEDEQELDEVDKFESQYNFRFEEIENAGGGGGGLLQVMVGIHG